MRILGIIIVGFCISCFGFIKAAKLHIRYKTLTNLLVGFSEAEQRIKLRQERDIIVERLFPPPLFTIIKNQLKITVECPSLTTQDNKLLCEFVDNLGMGDLNSQLKLLEVYKELLKGHISDAKETHRQKAGMYRTCGVLTAVAVVILLI